MNLTARDINKNGVFYHIAPIPLEVGAIIKKGNWGRIWRNDNIHNSNWLQVLRERTFEEIRSVHFPHLPSRLDCLFASDRIDKIKNYQTRCNPHGIIYKVQVLDLNCNAWIANWNEAFLIPNDAMIDFNLNYIKHLAINYWSNDWGSSPDSEILLDSDVKIVDVL